MKRILIITALLCGVFLPGKVAAQCLEYEPKVVTLSGTVMRKQDVIMKNFCSPPAE